MQPFETFEELRMHVTMAAEHLKRDPLVILKEKIYFLEFFKQRRKEFDQKLEHELELCKRLLEELLKEDKITELD